MATYELRLKLSNGNTISAGTFTTGRIVDFPHVWTQSGESYVWQTSGTLPSSTELDDCLRLDFCAPDETQKDYAYLYREAEGEDPDGTGRTYIRYGGVKEDGTGYVLTISSAGSGVSSWSLEEATVDSSAPTVTIAASATSGNMTAQNISLLSKPGCLLYKLDLDLWFVRSKASGSIIVYTSFDVAENRVVQITINKTSGTWSQTTQQYQNISDRQTYISLSNANDNSYPTSRAVCSYVSSRLDEVAFGDPRVPFNFESRSTEIDELEYQRCTGLGSYLCGASERPDSGEPAVAYTCLQQTSYVLNIETGKADVTYSNGAITVMFTHDSTSYNVAVDGGY